MGKTSKGSPARVREKSVSLSGKSPKQGKKATNLTLDQEALARGERFSRQHGTSVSQLVTRFLYSLPSEVDADAKAVPNGLTTVVQRLYGAAAGGKADRAMYRAHLLEKYRG